MERDPAKRPSAEMALKHVFLSEAEGSPKTRELSGAMVQWDVHTGVLSWSGDAVRDAEQTAVAPSWDAGDRWRENWTNVGPADSDEFVDDRGFDRTI